MSPAFPLSPLALIHVRQTVTAYVTMRSVLTTTCDMRCGVTEMRVTTKGVEIDFQFSIYSQEGELLADGVSTVLSRNQSTRLQFKQRSSVESKPFSGEKGMIFGYHWFSRKDLSLPPAWPNTTKHPPAWPNTRKFPSRYTGKFSQGKDCGYSTVCLAMLGGCLVVFGHAGGCLVVFGHAWGMFRSVWPCWGDVW